MVSGTGPVGAEDLDVAGQTAQCLKLIELALQQAGASLEHVVRTRMYLTSSQDWEAVGRVHGRHFAKNRPAATMVVVAALLDPRWVIEMEADALLPG